MRRALKTQNPLARVRAVLPFRAASPGLSGTHPATASGWGCEASAFTRS